MNPESKTAQASALPAATACDGTANPTQPVETVDMTQTWGEWGAVYRRFAESGETRVLCALRQDFAKAMAACQALQELQSLLTPEQKASVAATMARELSKQRVQ